MKRIKYIILLLICLITFKAQTQISIGLKTGYTHAWQNYGDITLPDNAVVHINGFNISVLGYVELNKYFELGIEPGYIKRGAACVPGWNIGIMPIFLSDTKFYLDYIELPLILSGKINTWNDRLTVFGKLGYGGSFLARAFREDITDVQNQVFISEINLRQSTNFLKRWNHGIYTGAGIGYNIKKHQVFFSADYYIGLIDVDRINVSKNRNLNFNVGYKFKLN